MKRGKILSLLVATSITAGTFAGVQIPQITYAQDVSQNESNMDLDNQDDSVENTSGEVESEEGTSTKVVSIDLNEEITSIDDINIDYLEDNEETAIIANSESSSSIDTSEFDSQESFDGDYDEIEENEAGVQAIDDATTRVSENYYNFNIAGAQKYTYGTSGNGRPLYYYKIGNGDKVLFLNFGIHGYEDAWSRDGEELTKLAKNLIERIASDNASSGLNGWTVVIVPTSNPDGVLDGWTNNGPGRTQVSQKIDLNRSFPTYFTPQYSARYYTGSTPLAAPEAKALASLVDQYSESSSHMALVDVHGWLDQTIGDPSLGNAFDTSFGMSNKLLSTSASGYLISYAHSKGALVTLLELPMPSSQSAIQSNGYANKIYNGVKSIINNGDGFEVMSAEGQVVNTNSLNIRITTSTNSNIIGSYSNGTKINILGKVGDWYQVKSSAGYGYVHKDYIKILSDNTNSDSSGTVEVPTSYQIGKVSNISTSLNVRKSASTSSSVITRLTNGTEVKIVGTEGDWYKIYSESFGYGYVSKSYITIVSNDNSGDNTQDTTTETGTIINISTALNVRESASTSSKIIGTLKNGESINIVAKEGNWYKIQDSSFGTGYVYGDYVKVNSTTTPEEPSTPETPSTPDTNTTTQTGQVVNVTSKLNIRSGAGTNYGIIGTLGPNATVNILGQEGSWYKISYNGVTGYVSSSYIKVNSSDNNTNTDSTVKYGKVVNISTKLNIRKSASTSSSIIGTLNNNTKVIILEKLSGWYKISYNGIEGYVSASYLTEI